ncbi:hypothetical protein EXIGLDRAFT_136164 [Exidia glandulosa HHB12029]|uniref:Velvet domain-containing protein n=1 Tax=Exidia glandulosa HHB12029 TaxID=1314781 RepID=A0A165G200_EXIGL|nr:hypothetical protein EXIGLDRAFT_136164 [Exidia glandulosa HHB12029]
MRRRAGHHRCGRRRSSPSIVVVVVSDSDSELEDGPEEEAKQRSERRRASGAAEDRVHEKGARYILPARLEPCARRPPFLLPHIWSRARSMAHHRHVQTSLTSVQRARLDRAPTVGSGLPGPDAPPWYCAGGALAGKYLKADVEEVQKPDMTRKLSSNLTRTGVGSRDARPLAPPPIVRVRLWECKENGDRIREVDMKYVYVLGLSVSW